MRCFLFLYAMFFPAVGFGQAMQWVGLNIQVSNLVAHRQERSNWCWAASAQMVLSSYGLQISQERIVQQIHGNIGDRPGTDEEITATLNGSALLPSGKALVHATLGHGFPSSDLLIEELSHGRPMVIALDTRQIGHAVVVTAAGIVTSGSGSYIRSLVVRDPWPSQEHIATGGRVEYDDVALESFAAKVSSYWTVHVSIVPSSFQAYSGATPAPGVVEQNPQGSGSVTHLRVQRQPYNFETHPAHSDIGPDEDAWTYSPIFKRVVALAEQKQLATLKSTKANSWDEDEFPVTRFDLPTTGCIIKGEPKYLSYFCEIFTDDPDKAEVEAAKLKNAFNAFGPLVATGSSKNNKYWSQNYTLRNGVAITIAVHSENRNPSATVEINNKE